MACYHMKHFSDSKDFTHPNKNWNIDHYRKGFYYILPGYHGCGLKDKNGARKWNDYERGYQCILPTKNLIGKKQKINRNYLVFTMLDIKHIINLPLR